MLTTLEIKVLAGVGLLGAVLVGVGLWQSHERSLGKAEAQADQAQRDLQTEKSARAEEQRRTAAVQEKANAADQQASAARADAAAARTAGDRLRVRLAAAERSRITSNPAASCAGATGSGDTPELVPFDMFEGLRVMAGQASAYADDLSVRLNTCVASYEALSLPKGNP